MSRHWGFGGLLPAIVLALGAAATPPVHAERPVVAAGACAPSLVLTWVDRDGTAADLLADAERETTRVWEAAGITLDWARPGPSRTSGRDEILVVVRAELRRHEADTPAKRRRTTLGRLIRASAEQPGRVIEVALADIVDTVLPLTVHGRTLRDFPPRVRDRVIGRALGRVVAHEIGHWLFGRGHAPTGLMRASIRRPDLIAEEPPPLPAAWLPAALAQLRTHRPCPAPRVVHQPVTE